MCSFRSCQTRFEFLSQFRLPKTKCVWPMKINVICTVVLVPETSSRTNLSVTYKRRNCKIGSRTTIIILSNSSTLNLASREHKIEWHVIKSCTMLNWIYNRFVILRRTLIYNYISNIVVFLSYRLWRVKTGVLSSIWWAKAAMRYAGVVCYLLFSHTSDFPMLRTVVR